MKITILCVGKIKEKFYRDAIEEYAKRLTRYCKLETVSYTHLNVMVSFRELVESEEFKKHPSKISFGVGKDIGGKVTVADIAKMPHLLIAGATGSGKSVCINTIIMSILYKANPKEVKLIMIEMCIRDRM